MRFKIATSLALCSFLLIVAFSNVAYSKIALQVRKVSAQPKVIDLTKNESVTVKFEITDKAFITILFKDENENILKRAELGMKERGAHSFQWDGRGQDGSFVSTDVVIYLINARTEDGHYARYDPNPLTGGVELSGLEFVFDKEYKTISYTLPKTSRVRVRAGLTGGVLLKTIYDWKPQSAMHYQFIWDGYDQSSHISLSEHPKLNLNLSAFSLPDNAIIIENPEPAHLPPNQSFGEVKQGRHFHFPHPRLHCHEPRFKVSFLNKIEKDDENVIIVKGKVPLQVVIDPRDEAALIQNQFEVMFFIDTSFLFEEEKANSPSTFYLDFNDLTPGYHLVTVNVMTYDDHIGIETLKVKVVK